MMHVTPDPYTIIIIKSAVPDPECSVCETKDSKQKCNPKNLTLRDLTNTSVEFTCPRPQDVYTVEINREIGMNVNKQT